MIRFAWILAACLACSLAWPKPQHSPRPGGIVVLHLDGELRPAVSFNDKPAMVLRDDEGWVAVVGIPLDQATDTPLNIVIEQENGARKIVPIDIEDANYRVQRLTVDRKYVEPDPQSLERIFAERKIIDAALGNWRDHELADVILAAPVPGARSSSFGSRRIFNDQPRSPHKGMDISATTGTPILAPLGGKVTAVGDFYFNGNTVILDHGQGFVSLYCHLSSIDVVADQQLATGAVLGKVGATGRVTGAHLHFATYLNGTAVDPAILLQP